MTVLQPARCLRVSARPLRTAFPAIKPVVPLAEPLETIDLSEVRTRPIDWLWRGYIPLRKVTILDGDPGLGKSTILLDLASRGSVGGLAPTGEPLGDAFTTIYVTIEDDAEDTILPRVLRAGGDPSRFHLLRKLVLPDQIDRLEATATSLKARLIVIDPLMAYLGDGVKTNDDHLVRRALEPLAEMAARLDAAVVAIRHLNKRAGDDAIYRGGGSIGFTGLARSVLAVGRDPDDARPDHPRADQAQRRPPAGFTRLSDRGRRSLRALAHRLGRNLRADRRGPDRADPRRGARALQDGRPRRRDRELLEANGGSMPAGEACRALKETASTSVHGTTSNAPEPRPASHSTKEGFGQGGSGPSDRQCADRTLRSLRRLTLPSKGPKSPKRPTKRPKGPISSSKEEPVSSTPDPSRTEGAATFWEDDSLLQGTVSASPKRSPEEAKMKVSAPLPSLTVEQVPIDHSARTRPTRDGSATRNSTPWSAAPPVRLRPAGPGAEGRPPSSVATSAWSPRAGWASTTVPVTLPRSIYRADETPHEAHAPAPVGEPAGRGRARRAESAPVGYVADGEFIAAPGGAPALRRGPA